MSRSSQAPELEELYAQFGRTAEMAQVMELEAGNLALSYAMVAFDLQNLTIEQKLILKSLSEDIDRRTFGNLVALMKQSMNISEAIEEAIDAGLEKRNYLIHRFFRTHNFGIHSVEGRARMAEDLAEIYQSLSRAHTILHGMTHTLNEIFGHPSITEEQARSFVVEGKRVEI